MGAEEPVAQRENRKAQLVCFDYDGVLVDSLSRTTRLFTQAQTRLGIGRPPTVEDLQNAKNLNLRDLALAMGVPLQRVPELAVKISEIQREDGSRPAMFPKIPEVVRQIAEHSIIVVITLNLRDEVLDVFSAHGLGDCVSLVLDGNDPRPKSERICWALDHFRVNRTNAYMVGDACSDIREGKAAGVRTVAVTWGYQPREFLVAEDPDFVADHPEQLVAILNEQ